MIYEVCLLQNNMSEFENIKNAKYVLLETYKKNNQPVQTPVWVVQIDDLLCVVTRDQTGKIKRLRNNSHVKLAVCTFNGKIIGDWISGMARFENEKNTKTIIELRKKNMVFWKK